jgi:branched-chain amino acid transport system substrate-binding protein
MLQSHRVGARLISWRGFAGLLLAGLLSMSSGGALPQTKAPYVIGAVLSLSGPVAANGVPTRDGIQLAVEQINAAGGIDGHPVQVLFEDDQSKPDQAVILANKLITQDKVLMLLGASFGSTTNAIAAVVDKLKIPHLSATAWTKADLRLVPQTFYFLVDFETVMDQMLGYIAKDLGVKRIGMLRLTREYGQIASEALAKLKAKHGIEVVKEERGNDPDTDFTPQLTNIRAAKPEAMISWFANPAGAISIKNMRQLGLNVPVLGPVSMATRPMITAGGPAAEGTILQSFIAADDPLPRQKAFVDAFNKKHGKLPEVFESVGFDMAQVGFMALKKVGGDRPDPAKLRDEIERTQYDGVALILRYNAKVHEPDAQSILFTKVQKGRFVRARQ